MRLLVALGLLLLPTAAQAATTSIAPGSITTTKGTTGGQPVGNLAVQDQSGTQDTWSKYVELSPSGSTPYDGYRSYTLPSTITPSSITALQVKANYRGPSSAEQTWTWAIYNWSTSAWVTLGTNSGAPSWGSWKLFTFSGSGTFSNYVRTSDNAIRIQLKANNASDSADIDYESVTVTHLDPPAGGIWKPPLNSRWQYQLAGNDDFPLTGGINVDICKVPYTGGACVKPTVFDIDLYVAPDLVMGKNDVPNTAAVNAIHNNGGKVICYLDAGGIETYRPDYATMKAYDDAQPAGSKLFGPNVDGYPEEYWANIHIAAHRDFMVDIHEARLDECKDAGFDGVEFDLVDAYDTDSHAETAPLGITYADQIAYNEALAKAAHDRGLSAALKNDVGQVSDLVDNFDYAVNEQCFQYKECDNLKQFISAGKPVFQVEYSFAPSKFCPDANSPAWNFNSIKKGASEDSLDTPYQSCR